MPLSNSSAVPPAVHSIHNNQVILSPRIKQFPSPSKENHEHRRTSSRENSAISEKFSPVLNNNSNSKQRQNISNNSPQRQLTFLNSPQRNVPSLSSPQRNVPSLSSPQRQVSSLNSPQRKVPSLNSPQRQFSSINSSQRQVPSLNSPLRQVSSINSSQIQDPSLNTLQRQVSSNLNSKKNIILHRQNSNPSKILSNTSSILQNTTNSLPRPNYGKDRRSNMNNNANNDGYLSSPRHAGMAKESKGLCMFYKQRTKLNEQDPDSLGSESPEYLIKQNTFDRVNIQDLPRNRKCLSPDNSQNIAHINNKNYSPVHVTSKITDQSDISIEETFGPIFGDVDPINPPTGIPITLRSNIDKEKQKDWYKQMYASIHKGEKTEGSTMSLGRSQRAPTIAKCSNKVYKCEPKSILDYEPGNNSIKNTPFYNTPRDYSESDSECFSSYLDPRSPQDNSNSNGYYSDADDVYRANKYSKGRSSTGSARAGATTSGYCTDTGGEYRQTFAAQPCTIFNGVSTINRRSRNQQQQDRLVKVYEEQRIKKFRDDIQESESRRLGDIYNRQQIIPSDRFDDITQQYKEIDRPEKNRPTKIRGKARALYSFRAQNRREITFRRGEMIYLLRCIDKNWYEGEHNGRVGLFPVRYVEVIKSIEEASFAASLREGRAIAKFTFKPESADELSLRKGDEITLIRRLDDNWLEGRCAGVQGIFPLTYVDIINSPQTPLMTPMTTPLGSYACTPDNGSPGQMSPVSTMSNGAAPTIPSAPISPRRLSVDFTSDVGGFDFNDYLNRQKQRDASARHYNNYSRERAKSNQSNNIFEKAAPASHLPIMQISRDGSSRRYKETNYPPYRVVYDYSPRSDDELKLCIGDLVYVVEKCDDGWYVGTSNASKQFGTFPGNYVKPV